MKEKTLSEKVVDFTGGIGTVLDEIENWDGAIHPEDAKKHINSFIEKLKSELSPIFKMIGNMSRKEIMIYTFQEKDQAIKIQDLYEKEIINKIAKEEFGDLNEN